MCSIYPLIFSLLLLVACGKHEQSSSGSQGVQNTNQVTNPDALSQDIMTENIPNLEKYFAAGGNPSFELTNGRTLLTEACFWSKLKTISYLISEKADLLLKDRSGKSAVDYAEEDLKIKRALYPELTLKLKATLVNQVRNNLINDLKKTLEENPPLNFIVSAKELGEEETIMEGETILTYVVKNKLEGILRLIAQPKFELDVSLKNARGESPLQLAIKLNLKNIEKLLVKLGATE